MAKPGAFGMHLGAIVDVRGLLTYVYTLYKLGMITILLWQILLPNQYFQGRQRVCNNAQLIWKINLLLHMTLSGFYVGQKQTSFSNTLGLVIDSDQRQTCILRPPFKEIESNLSESTRPGKPTKHNYGTSPCHLWVNPLFQWSFSITMLT